MDLPQNPFPFPKRVCLKMFLMLFLEYECGECSILSEWVSRQLSAPCPGDRRSVCGLFVAWVPRGVATLQSASSECLLPFCHFLSLILASINSLNNNKEKLKTAFGRSIVLHDDRLTWWANTITCVGVNTKTRISTLIRMARVQSGVGIFTDFDSFQQREAHAHKIGFLLHTFAKYWLTPRAPVWQN